MTVSGRTFLDAWLHRRLWNLLITGGNETERSQEHPGKSRIVMMVFTNKLYSMPTRTSGKSRGGALRVVGTSLLGSRI